MYRKVVALSLATLVTLTFSACNEEKKVVMDNGQVVFEGDVPKPADDFATVKGQVVFDGAVPKRAAVNVDTDKAFCTKDGPVLSDELIVDHKTKGVKWVMVWLVDEKGGSKLPINPALPKPEAKVTIDQPCCSFEPHVMCVRQGQIVVNKNSATVTHNVNIIGGEDNPNKNGEFEIKGAPAGNYRIVIWQESIGWVVRDGTKSGKLGIPIEIKAAGSDLGAIKLAPPAPAK
jgi:plastocyanin